MLRYLEDFVREFRFNELVRYEIEVWYVGLEMDGKWKVRFKSKGGGDGNELDEIYDVVVVCNGYYIELRIVNIFGNFYY